MYALWETWCLFCGAMIAIALAGCLAMECLIMLSYIIYELLTINWRVAVTRPLLTLQFTGWCCIQAVRYSVWEGWPTEMTDGDWVWSYPCYIRRWPAD